MAFDQSTSLTIKANVVGQGQISGLEKGLGRVTGQTNKATGAMARLRGAAGGALGAMRSFLPVLGVAAIASFTKNNLQAADSMSKLSQRTGIAAPELDKFRKVAELSDTSIQSLEKAFPALSRGIDEATQKAKGPAFDAFSRLGVSFADATGKARATDKVMLSLADKFRQLPDGTEKAALASQIFGQRLGSELIPLLNSGGDAVRNMGTALTQDFADKAAEFNDSLENLQEKLGDLGLRLTQALLPALEATVDVVTGLSNAFSALPEPLQSVVASLAVISASLVILAPVISAIGSAIAAITALKIGATIAGFAPVIVQVTGVLFGLLKAIALVFTGPVGWAALLVGAGIALFAFREEIGAFIKSVFTAFSGLLDSIRQFFVDSFNFISANFIEPFRSKIDEFVSAALQAFSGMIASVGDFFMAGLEFIAVNFIEPIKVKIQEAVTFMTDTFALVKEAITSPFTAAFEAVKGIVSSILSAIVSKLNFAIKLINKVIKGANKIPKVNIPRIPSVSVPEFAKGGMVDGAQLALVGEAGPEYIVPASKAQGFAQNIISGKRGASAIPAFANGGYVDGGVNMLRQRMGRSSGSAASSPVNLTIRTGPVMQQGGQQFVTMKDFQDGIKQAIDATTRGNQSYGNRVYMGAS